jgi:hypothetical protein
MRMILLSTAGIAVVLAMSAGAQPALAGTPEVVAACSASPDAATFVACVGGALTAEEATKCFASHFADCYGPNNDARKFIERNVVGPATDIARGDIGQSDQSVWRQMGLPHIKLW